MLSERAMLCIAGKNDIAVESVRFLLEQLRIDKKDILACVTRSDIGTDGFQRSFRKYCQTEGVKIVDLSDVITEKNIIFISLQFDRIVPVEKMESQALFNIHFSLLPAYRGMYTSIWPILNGEKYSGVTLHRLDKGIDTGEIIAQKKILISPDETARSLYLKYIEQGITLFKEHIRSVLTGDYDARAQPIVGATYYSKKSLDFSDLRVDFNKTAWQVCAQMRAYSFKEYQRALVNGYAIEAAEILMRTSTLKAGTLVEERKNYMDIATMDYDVRCYKDEMAGM